MSEFKELIKSFSRSREYIHDFFIYGFKTRDDFTDKARAPMTMRGGALKAGSGNISTLIIHIKGKIFHLLWTAAFLTPTRCTVPGKQKASQLMI